MIWNKIINLAKKYWQYILLFFGAIFTFILFRKKDSPVDDQTKSRKDKDKQLDVIDDVRKEERKEHDNADKKLKEGLEIVEKQYQEQKKELDEKKKQEVKNVLEKYKDDPTGLAKKLSEVTGFKIIMPDE